MPTMPIPTPVPVVAATESPFQTLLPFLACSSLLLGLTRVHSVVSAAGAATDTSRTDVEVETEVEVEVGSYVDVDPAFNVLLKKDYNICDMN